MTPEALIAENARRHAALQAPFDPASGIGSSGQRRRVGEVWLPESMLADADYRPGMSPEELARLRCRHDFEFWACKCVKVRDKLTGAMVPFVLNRPQRRVAALLEAQRRSSQPLRLIMLKARQWGGSTLVQMYMAWIQMALKTNWNSLICGHVKDASATIRTMYADMLAEYPAWALEPDQPAPKLNAVGGSANIREIAGRGCRIALATAERQDSARGQAISMAHLSEVAFWPATPRHSPVDFIRSVCSGVPLEPLTLIALESTANGVGSYFHTEWLRAESGESDKMPVFVPWYEIDIYRLAVPDAMAVWNSMDAYERALWEEHSEVTLEAINWYHHKRREYTTHTAMQAEYPSNPVEAFVTSGNAVFSPERVQQLRAGCSAPAEVGDVVEREGRPEFIPSAMGRLKVWHRPDDTGGRLSNRYVAVVDVGGRSASADWSVIAVIERRIDATPRVVAQWRGHIDHDLLADIAVAICRWYRNAHLVIESNTLETEWDGDSTFVLERIHARYSNMYTRVRRDTVSGTVERRLGFHTNRSTKELAVATLVAAVRDGTYIEADLDACNEMDTYECTRTGSYGARIGYHDDILMTRAIGLYVISVMPPAAPAATRELLATASW